MSNENEGTLQKLKALALGDKQPRTDTLELGPEMIAAQDQEDIDDLDMHEEGIEITAEAQIEAEVEEAEELPAPPPPPIPSPRPEPIAVDKPETPREIADTEEDAERDTENADETVSLDRLMKGDLYPRLSMPLSMASDYDLMNAALRDGRLRIDAVEGQPTLVMTDQSIRSLVEDEKRAASEVISRIDKAGEDIAELERRLASAKATKAQDLETASQHSERIRQLQKHIEGK
ncbi:hypothetical protein [uncultured Salinicola sp.]|uniref:hypothetical protein n=1 Tax=uncultured Salinicola sp. TaxID=1193542 RepID=UPI0026213818|nr:hypothetical protein [uncultured Salinicola sp.]|tara:strand:+ start:2438 stop:3136 length:699 start_codon:yes stop_codon:yes gene_type:complete